MGGGSAEDIFFMREKKKMGNTAATETIHFVCVRYNDDNETEEAHFCPDHMPLIMGIVGSIQVDFGSSYKVHKILTNKTTPAEQMLEHGTVLETYSMGSQRDLEIVHWLFRRKTKLPDLHSKTFF
jgi:hypothetical protein